MCPANLLCGNSPRSLLVSRSVMNPRWLRWYMWSLGSGPSARHEFGISFPWGYLSECATCFPFVPLWWKGGTAGCPHEWPLADGISFVKAARDVKCSPRKMHDRPLNPNLWPSPLVCFSFHSSKQRHRLVWTGHDVTRPFILSIRLWKNQEPWKKTT